MVNVRVRLIEGEKISTGVFVFDWRNKDWQKGLDKMGIRSNPKRSWMGKDRSGVTVRLMMRNLAFEVSMSNRSGDQKGLQPEVQAS
jgi:hypothetical protein